MGVMAGISTHVDACVCVVGVGLRDQPTYLIKFTNWIGINVNQEQETAAAGGKAWQGRQVVGLTVSLLEVKIRCLTIGLFVWKPMAV